MYAYIYVCVRGEGEEKRIQNVAMLIYLSKSLYGIFIKYIYIYSFSSYIFTNKIVYLGIWSSFVLRNPLRTNSIAVKLSEITM